METRGGVYIKCRKCLSEKTVCAAVLLVVPRDVHFLTNSSCRWYHLRRSPASCIHCSVATAESCLSTSTVALYWWGCLAPTLAERACCPLHHSRLRHSITSLAGQSCRATWPVNLSLGAGPAPLGAYGSIPAIALEVFAFSPTSPGYRSSGCHWPS